jgi:hypothetical protein
VLDRDQNGMTLYVRGRDVEENESALRHDLGVWSILGEAADVTRSDERVTIAATLKEATEPMSPMLLADVTGMKPGNIRRLLHSMGIDGEVSKIGRGLYVHPDNEAKFRAKTTDIRTPGNIGNNGNIDEREADE